MTTPTDDTELRKTVLKLCVKHRISEGVNFEELLFEDELLALIHQYGNTRAVEALKTVKSKSYSYQPTPNPNSYASVVDVEDIDTLIKALTQPQREEQ